MQKIPISTIMESTWMIRSVLSFLPPEPRHVMPPMVSCGANMSFWQMVMTIQSHFVEQMLKSRWSIGYHKKYWNCHLMVLMNLCGWWRESEIPQMHSMKTIFWSTHKMQNLGLPSRDLVSHLHGPPCLDGNTSSKRTEVLFSLNSWAWNYCDFPLPY